MKIERHSFCRLFALMGIAALHVGVVTAGDVAAYRGLENNGVYQETGLLKTWPADGPKFLWKQMLGQAYCGVSVADGIVWILSGSDGRLTGFTMDGETKYNYVVGSMTCPGSRFPGPRCTPLIRDGIAVVACLNADIHGIDLKTGEKKWKVNAWKDFGSGQGKMGWGYPSSPVAFEDKVILNTVSRNDETPPIVAVDFATGKTVWQADAGVSNKYSCGDHAAAVFQHNGRWLNVNPTWRHILCLDPRDGKQLWRISDRDVKAGSEKGLSPVYGDGYVLFDRGGVATCVKLNADGTGYTPVWARQYGGQGFSHGVIIGKRAYLGGTVLQATWQGAAALTEANLNSPKIQPLSQSKNAIAPPPRMPGGLVCVDAETGVLVDIIRMRESLGHVVAADGMIYAVDYEANPRSLPGVAKPGLNVYLIQPTATGMEIRGQFCLPMKPDDWRVKDMEWQANAPPVIAHGRLFMRYGPLWAFDLRPDQNVLKDEPVPPVPPSAYWDLFLRGFFDDKRDLIVTIEVKDSVVISGAAVATSWNNATHAVDTKGVTFTTNGLSGVLALTLYPDVVPSDKKPVICEVKIDAKSVRGQVVGTYAGEDAQPAARSGDSGRDRSIVGIFAGRPKGTRVDGRVTAIIPPPTVPPQPGVAPVSDIPTL